MPPKILVQGLYLTVHFLHIDSLNLSGKDEDFNTAIKPASKQSKSESIPASLHISLEKDN